MPKSIGVYLPAVQPKIEESGHGHGSVGKEGKLESDVGGRNRGDEIDNRRDELVFLGADG